MTAITRLRVGDEAFLVATMIERCPKSMMIRELVQNALEAAASAPEGERRVELSATRIAGTRKLAIWNTGRGLTADELYRMCDIAAAINKETGLDANFGMGAKVASLPSNQHGLRYRSCRDGVVHEVLLGKRGGIYGRVHQPGPGGTPIEIVEATAAAQAEGRSTGHDWTEVVLLGNHADQDTVADPYDGQPRSPSHWLVEAIASRYFRLPAGTTVTLMPGVRPRPLAIRGAARRVAALAQYERVALPGGIAIHYAYDPPSLDRPGRNLSQASGPENAEGLAALAFRDEMYAVLRGAHWRREAPSFGIATGARHVSLIVELPPRYPAQIEGYREFLRYRGDLQKPLRLLDFAPLAVAHQPAWLKDILASTSPAASLVIDARFAMEELLRDLGVTRLRRAVAVPAAEAAPAPATPTDVAPAEAQDTPPEPPATRTEDDPRAPPIMVLETAPEIFLLREPGEIADAELTHRAARYYPESHQLHINMVYPAVASLARMLSGAEPGEAMAPEAVDVAERFTVMRVARAVVHALAKRGRPREWNEAQLRAVLAPESLSLAADDVHAGLTDARAVYAQAVAVTPDDA